MNNWEKMKFKRQRGQVVTPAYRRYDRRSSTCKQEEIFGKTVLCDCPSCMEAYRQRVFWRQAKNAGHFIPLHKIQLVEQERKSFPIRFAVQHPAELKGK